MAVHIYCLTDAGNRLAGSVASAVEQLGHDAAVFHCAKPFADKVQASFNNGHRLVMICATGIVVRTLAPVLRDKYHDPAVLVLDEAGQYVIPLLSGHEGGANEFARQLSAVIGAHLVQTTANPYLKPVYALGMGCERHCPLEFLETLMLEALDQAGLKVTDIRCLASIDIKADETQLIALAEKYHWRFQCFPADVLGRFEGQLSQHSEYVFKTVGVYGVAESACLAAVSEETGQPAELILNKIKNPKATCAVARSYPAVP